MTLSFTSILTNVFLSSLLILLVSFLLRNNHIIKRIGISSLFFCILIIMFRLLIPFEFSFAKNLAFKRVLPEIVLFVETHVITFGTFNINFRQILFWVWGVGILLNFIKSLWSYLHFRKIIRVLPSVKNIQFENILHIILEKYSKPKSFRIIQTDLVSTPLIFGVWNPIIVIPLIELSEKDWKYILSHEVAHYYRGDLWIKTFFELLRVLYWWNPFIYILKKQMTKTLELQIDLTVTNQMSESERIEYLESLLKIAKSNACQHVDKLALTFSNESSSILLQRFYMVLEDNSVKKKLKSQSVLAILPILFLFFSSFFYVFEPYSISPIDEAATVELTNENAYLVLNQNGGYDVYLNHKYYATVHKIMDSYSDLQIYKNIKEVQKE